MALDVDQSDLTLAVVGTGAMGRGIAQIAAAAGIRTLLADARPQAVQEAIGFIGRMLDRQAEKGRMTAGQSERAKACLHEVSMDDATLGRCGVVVEAIAEDLEAKRALFSRLEQRVSEDCILATNTSSLSVTAIAAACRLPQRVAGFHFFNPVPLMKIVEVAAGPLTSPAAADALMRLGQRMGHFAARTQDTPGFLVNHAGRGLGTEGLRIVDEGISDFAGVDRVLREQAGFRMGPFELIDLTGLDVSHPVMESIYEQFYHEPRFRPSPITRQRLDAGLIGRKAGRGFYDYPDGKMAPPPEQPIPDAVKRPVWVSPANEDGHRIAVDLLQSLGAERDAGSHPASESLCLVTPVGNDATTAALEQRLDPARTVALDTVFPLDKRRTLMATPVTEPAARDAAHALLAADGVPVTVIRDSPGFIAQRVVATIVNIGCEICQRRIGSPQDLDNAVTLGLGYPMGPLAYGDHLGAPRVLEILQALERFYGDPRYRPSPWLRRRARLGVSLTTAQD